MANNALFTSKQRPKESHINSDDTRKVISHCNNRLGGLKSVRSSWESEWKDLRDLMRPRAGLSLDGGNPMDGKRRSSKIFNGRPQYYVNILVAGLMSSVVPKVTPWFKFVCQDPGLQKRWAVKTWLKSCEDIILDDLRKSKFYENTHTGFMHSAIFGSYVGGIFESNKNVIASKSLDIGEFYLGEDFDGDLDTVIRDLYLTVAQLVDKFGIEHVSDDVRRDYNSRKNLDRIIHVIHAVMPNYPESLTAQHWAYQSVYYEYSETNKVLKSEGFDELPFVTMPWTQDGNHTYGISPAMDALGDIKELQKRSVQSLKASDEMIDPAMVYDASFSGKMIHDYPGGRNYFDNLHAMGKAPVQPLKPQNIALQHYRAERMDLEQRISEFFFTDLFLMLSNDTRSNITAREVAERHEEKLMILGPVADSFQRNYLMPTIERCFKIRERYNMLPPLPEELQGQALNIDFMGTLAQAQKMVRVSETERFLSLVHGVAQVNPTVLHKVNYDRTIDHVAESIGIDPSIMATDAEVTQARDAAAQQQQQAQAMTQMESISKSAKDLSGAKDQNGRSIIDTLKEVSENGQL